MGKGNQEQGKAFKIQVIRRTKLSHHNERLEATLLSLDVRRKTEAARTSDPVKSRPDSTQLASSQDQSSTGRSTSLPLEANEVVSMIDDVKLERLKL